MNITQDSNTCLPGIKPVLEILQTHPEKIDLVMVRSQGETAEIHAVQKLCDKAGIRVQRVRAAILDKLCLRKGSSKGIQHQGIVARLVSQAFVSMETLLSAVQEAPLPLIVALDQVQDPGNIGTLARSEQLRKILGDRARKHIAATYDWKHIIQKWITLVEELREIPFSEQEERTYRTAKHPAMLNIAKIFGHHPSKNISEEDLLKQVICLSRRGKNVLGKKDVSVCWPNLTTYTKDVDIRKILVFARKKCTVAEIKERLASDGIEDERFQFIILWMIKHDLLEYSV